MIDFTSVEIPEIPDDNMPNDTVPPLQDVEYPCKECGREAGPYAGRGRKPTKCADCKPKSSRTGATKAVGSDAALASRAVEVLGQLNGFLAMGLLATGMTMTASTLAANNDAFKENALNALITDPALCRLILRGGVKSAKVALMVSYGGLVASIAPTALQEFKEQRAESV